MVTRDAEQLQRSALAYRGYWHWRVLYKHVRGTYLLDHGYPEVPAGLSAEPASGEACEGLEASRRRRCCADVGLIEQQAPAPVRRRTGSPRRK